MESRVRPEKKKNTGIAFARWVRGEARVLDASGTARVSSRVATPRVRASLYLVAGTRARAPSPRVALVLCGVRVPTAPGAALEFPGRDDGGTFFMCCSACSAISSSAFPRGDGTYGGCNPRNGANAAWYCCRNAFCSIVCDRTLMWVGAGG